MKPGDVNLVIYHKGCTDGFGAAWAAWTVLGERAEYHAAGFDEKPPFEKIKNKNVLIVDFSYPLPVLLEIKAAAKDLLLLDHHKTAMDSLGHLDFAHFDMNESGATLSWYFFHPDEPCPRFVELIADRDLWQFKLPKSREFSAAFLNVPFEFQRYNYHLNEQHLQATIQRGEVLLEYINENVRRLAKNAGLRSFADYKVGVVNSCTFISEIGNALADRADVDFGLVWYKDYKSGLYKCSLRSNDSKADVSVVAKLLGGGGHRNSSAFTTKDDLDWLFLPQSVSQPPQIAQ